MLWFLIVDIDYSLWTFMLDNFFSGFNVDNFLFLGFDVDNFLFSGFMVDNFFSRWTVVDHFPFHGEGFGFGESSFG